MFGTILLAVDSSPQAERAGALATKLAASTGDEVVVVHVTEIMVTRGGGGTVDLLGDQDGIQTAERHVKELEAAGVSARLVLGRALAGNIAQVIVEAAEKHDAGLIVMGSRGRTDLTSLLLGSVAHKVLHLSDRPVLVAP